MVRALYLGPRREFGKFLWMVKWFVLAGTLITLELMVRPRIKVTFGAL